MGDRASELRDIVRGTGRVFYSRSGRCLFLTPVLSSFFVLFGYLFFSSDAAARAASSPLPASGPLRVHPESPRDFAAGSGRPVYLTGSHTWSSLQDQGAKDPPPVFDYDRYLSFLQEHHHNFIRQWAWEQAR